jgi:hypothetical protein
MASTAEAEGAVVRTDLARQVTGEDQAAAGVDQHRHQREVDQQDLHEQRRAAQEADVETDRPLHAVAQEIFPETMAGLGQAADAQHQAPAGSGDHADDRGLEGHPGAFDEQGRIRR